MPRDYGRYRILTAPPPRRPLPVEYRVAAACETLQNVLTELQLPGPAAGEVEAAIVAVETVFEKYLGDDA